ncbi:MAG: CotH kinase family protein, partial [Planctomycetota bacterium]
MLKNLIGLLVCMTITGALTMTNAQRPPGGGFGFGFGGPGGGGPGGGPGGGGPGGGGPGGGGPGGPDRSETKIVDQFDSDQNGWLNAKERSAARVFATKSMGEKLGGGFGFGGPRGRGGPPGGGGPFGRGPSAEATPGRQIMKTSVDFFPDAGLYDVDIVRTVFIDFENDDWEKELEDFRRTDVDVPATLTVDGEVYEGVGIHFRGASSYDHVPSGFMRSLNVSMDTVNSDQRLYGYKTLNLLNANGDDSLLSTVLYSHIANQYLPAPKANLMKVVINGEYWGVYTNVQQFDKIFLTEHFGASKGTRWKVPGSPNADGGLRYLGEELQPYQTRFEMKSNDGKKAWQRLINLCRVLNETPTDNLVAELEPILDIDSTLAFLALDVALVNQDGYWTRASDYALFLDAGGQFHIVPHDMNEAFRSRGGGGPGGPGGPGRGGPGGRGPGGDRGRGGFGGG